MKQINNVSWIKRTILNPITFATPKNRPAIYILIFALFILIFYYYCPSPQSFTDVVKIKWKTDELGLIMEIITLLVIFSVWYSELASDWRNSLNRFLTVSFYYHDKLKIHCRYARLDKEESIRQMAQSLGRSVNFEIFLPIAPMLDSISESIQQDRDKKINEGHPFVHYDVSIKLTRSIDELGGKIRETEKAPLKENEYIEWLPPFRTITGTNIKP